MSRSVGRSSSRCEAALETEAVVPVRQASIRWASEAFNMFDNYCLEDKLPRAQMQASGGGAR